MNEKQQKQAIEQLFNLYKKTMSKNATELDMLRYSYYSMEVIAQNSSAEEFDALIKGVLTSKFKSGNSVQNIAAKLVQSKLCPPLFYDESISYTSPNLMQEVRNMIQVSNVVDNSIWNKYVKQYFATKNISPEKCTDYTKAFMLMEQIGLESNVALTLRAHTKSRYPKLLGMANVKGFLNRELEIESTLTKAKIVVLGGQEKYDEIMRILNKEVPFNADANKILQEALKACSGFGQIVRNFNSAINTKITGDYRVGHQFQVISKGRAVPLPTVDGNQTMGNCVSVLSTMLEKDIVDSIYTIQTENGIYHNDPALTQVQERSAVVEPEIVEESSESTEEVSFAIRFDEDASSME